MNVRKKYCSFERRVATGNLGKRRDVTRNRKVYVRVDMESTKDLLSRLSGRTIVQSGGCLVEDNQFGELVCSWGDIA